jgi:hypothetical protein
VNVGKDFGLRAEDFLRLTRKVFDAYISRADIPLYLGSYPTLKEGVNANLFLSAESVETVRAILRKLDNEGKTDSNTRMLSFKTEENLNDRLKAMAKMVVNNGEHVIRFHCLRKFLSDRLSIYTSESKWKQIVGKKVPESAYVSPLELTKVYKRALGDISYTKPNNNNNANERLQKLQNALKDVISIVMENDTTTAECKTKLKDIMQKIEA